MPTADLDIGTKIFNIETTAGEGPWLIRVPLTDKENNPVSLEGAVMSMEFRRSGNVGLADYVAQVQAGSGGDYDFDENDLMIDLDEQMAKGSYNHVAKVTLATGHSFLLKGITQVQ